MDGSADADPPRRVLVVEDEWLMAEELRTTLAGWGHVMLGPAPSVDKALAVVAAERLDAALLDLNLGDKTSYPIAEALRARGVPFAFVTGHTAADLKQEFCDVPVLSKPVQDDDLRRGLAALLKRPA